jgi:hypothetical protein
MKNNKVNWITIPGRVLSTVVTNVEDLLIVVIQIISAKSPVTFKMPHQRIVLTPQMLSLIALVARHLYQIYWASHARVAPLRSPIVKRNAKRHFLAVICASKCVMMANADLVSKKSKSHVVVDGLRLLRFVIKEWRNHLAVPELTDPRSTVEGMNVGSGAVQGRRKPANDKQLSASTVLALSTRILRPNTSASRSVDGLSNVVTTFVPSSAIKDLAAAVLKLYLMKSAVPAVERLFIHPNLVGPNLRRVLLIVLANAPAGILKSNTNATTTANPVPNAPSSWRNLAFAERRLSRTNLVGSLKFVAACLAVRN